MKFSEIIEQASELLQRKGRMSYLALQEEFELSDKQLAALKEELIEAQELAVDKNGKVLVWTGAGAPDATPQPAPSPPQSPATYTPPHLAERILAEQAAMESRGSADGERKTITALFADLKGSTALIEGLDPEEARAIIDPALQLMMDAVHRYDGYVAQALGDGIFALFGAPIAHEDHPQRALYAALRMQEEMRQYSDQSRLKGGIPLQMRVGINTGEVVVRSIRKDDLHTDYVPVGHSTNLAARMEQLATPGSIVISEYTRKLTEGYFELKALGAADIKGVDEPLNVYEVLGTGPLRTKLQVSARRGLTRFVGRYMELDQLQRAFAQAKDGQGQIVGVMGDPGLGKSRLFHEFKQSVHNRCLVLEAWGVSHGQSSPYLPLIELLKHYFQIEPGDEERQRRQKVIGQVLELDWSLEDTLPYVFALLGINDPTSSLHQMDPQIRRQRTFAALTRLLLRESHNQPLVLIVEDLHWIDTETQGALDALTKKLAAAPILLLVNYRPEYQHDWSRQTYTQLRLAPLGKAEATELLTFLLGTETSLRALKALILDKTEGTPFFMEEVVQTLIEEGALLGQRGNYRLAQAPSELHISPNVQGVLAARIDRLEPPEKELLQQLAIIGRQFPLGLIKQVVPQPEAELYGLLSALQAKEFLYEQPAFPEVEYIFKHALTQEVAYGTVLQEQRKALHERTGQAIERRYETSLDDHYSVLAHHYSHSDNTEKAVTYLGLAGQQAVQRSAYAEAMRHTTAALELLQTLPDTPKRSQRELPLQITLGPALQATKGWAAPDVEKVYTRARELCEQGGDTPQLSQALYGAWQLYILRSELPTAHQLGEQLLSLAHRVPDLALLPAAHRALGEPLLWLGEFSSARIHLEQGIRLYDLQQHRGQEFLYGLDSGVAIRSFAAYVLWFLGYPEQALKRVQEVLTLAQESLHLPSLAHARVVATWIHQCRREGRAVQEQAEAAMTLSTEQGFPLFLAAGTVLQGWALAEQGQGEAGIAQMRQGIAAWRATGAELLWPYFTALLAEGSGKGGQAEEGLALLAEAVEVMDRTGQGYYEAEIYRLQGELTLQQSQDAEEAESCFHKAMEIAQKQQAKSWELRAATSLARLWQQQGKKREAHELLSPIYTWFTEGFDMADLKDAKTVLDELAEGQ